MKKVNAQTKAAKAKENASQHKTKKKKSNAGKNGG